jgi:hypothetical protein
MNPSIFDGFHPEAGHTTIVSASDAAYYRLLRGLIQSIHDHRPDEQIAISVLDVGLTDQQIGELKSLGIRVVRPGWDFDFPVGKEPPGEWFKAMTARCHLPKYFPDFKLYIWIDADAWIQDWTAIQIFMVAAMGGMAICPELHPAYKDSFCYGTVYNHRMFDRYTQSFGELLARQLSERPIFNSGVFALHRDSKVWSEWAKWLQKAITEGEQVVRLSEQNALNAAIYLGGIPVTPLLANCNWICEQGLPVFNPNTGLLSEPTLPHNPLWIVHAADARLKPAELKVCLTGESIRLPLDYTEFVKMTRQPANGNHHALKH